MNIAQYFSGRGIARIVFCLVCCLLLGTAFVPSQVHAGQTVVIDGDVNDDVYGNGPPPHTTPPTTDTATGNTVNVNSGGNVIGYVHGGWASSASGTATVTGNSVTVNSGGRVVESVYGASASSGTGAAIATRNTVTISGGTVMGVNGGWASSFSGTATATGNSVTINSGWVVGEVYGGFVSITNGGSGAATASGNSVIISGGRVGESVYGGWASSSGLDAVTATGNTVTISGSPTFGGSTILYGGQISGAGTSDAFTGNTLNVWNYSGTAVNGVENFEFFNFRFPSTQTGPVLDVTGTAYLNDDAGRGSTVTEVSTLGGTAPLQPGAGVTLIDASAGTLDTANFTQTQAQGQHGATLNYNWTLDTAGKKLTATLNSVQADPRAKALSEGFVSGVAFVNQGADLVAGKGTAHAVDAAGKAGASGHGFGSFAALSGGWSRYNTGSHVDMSSVNLIAGLSFGADLAPGRLTLGAFFEWGNGSYDTHNSFSHAADVSGDGNSYYLGGGILGRMDFIESGPGNFYTEAGFRAGGLHNDYSSSDLRDAMGHEASYDSYSPYYGIHAGLGYIWKFTEQASFDLYGKYFWTRQQGDSVTLSTGDPVKFKDVDSHRLRLGGRFAYAVNEQVSPYVGAAWEYEMDGRARASTYGYDIDAPSLRGGTGIGELGLNIKPAADSPFSLDLGVQGYTGRREGVTGSLQLKFEF